MQDVPPPPSAVVVGASFAGLLAAAAAAQAGYRVTVLERDRLAAADVRAGVPQGPQPHILLRRGLLAIDALLPDVGEELLARGGVRVDTGRMPWLAEHGWLPQRGWGHEIISLGRPLLEQVVRERVVGLPGVELRQGVRVRGLERTSSGWRVLAHETPVEADLVVDASGRSSRLPQWLADLGLPRPEPTVVDAHLGYATRRYRGRLPLTSGISVASTVDRPSSGLALPIEDDRWLVLAAGYGDHRPGRAEEAYEAHLAGLRDPVFVDLISALEPDGEVTVHRQTANRRYPYGRRRDWPAGLLVVGDALCAFDPLYGQGITVAALQAEVLREALPAVGLDARSTRRLQRRLARTADFCWAMASGEDLRMPSSEGRQNLGQRLVGAYVRRAGRVAHGGDEACGRAIGDVYHLMGPPTLLFRPPVVRAVLRSLVRGPGPVPPRPVELDELRRSPQPWVAQNASKSS